MSAPCCWRVDAKIESVDDQESSCRLQLSFVDHDAATGHLDAHYTGVKSIFGDQSETLSLMVVPLESADPSAVDAALADLLRTRKTLYAAHGEIVLPMIDTADENCGVVISLGGLMLCLPRNACCGDDNEIFINDEENVLIALVGN